MKIVIIGNGILAYATAFRLLENIKSNDKIIIIGKKERRGSATLVAPAMLNSFAELEPDALLSKVGRYKFEMSMKATKMWPSMLSNIVKLANDVTGNTYAGYEEKRLSGWFDVGTYLINNTMADSLDDENFNSVVTALKTYSEPFEWVDAYDIPNYHPTQNARATRAIYIANEGWFNPRILIEMLESIFQQHQQVTIIDSYVSSLTQRGDTIDYAQLENGDKIQGDRFLLAIGAATTDLIQKSKLTIHTQRVFYGVGVTLQINTPQYPHKKCIRTPNRGLACGLYTVPYFNIDDSESNHIAIGASNYISATPKRRGSLSSVSGLMNGVIEQINTNFYKSELVSVNVGERPLSQDGYPLVGKTSIANLVIATGTRREGIHLAPVLSIELANIIRNGVIDNDISLFHPERDLIIELSREAAITKAVKHLISAAYQHGFRPSDESMVNKLKEKYVADLEKLHDDVGAVDWGIPADMLDMYRYGHALPLTKEKILLSA